MIAADERLNRTRKVEGINAWVNAFEAAGDGTNRGENKV